MASQVKYVLSPPARPYICGACHLRHIVSFKWSHHILRCKDDCGRQRSGFLYGFTGVPSKTRKSLDVKIQSPDKRNMRPADFLRSKITPERVEDICARLKPIQGVCRCQRYRKA